MSNENKCTCHQAPEQQEENGHTRYCEAGLEPSYCHTEPKTPDWRESVEGMKVKHDVEYDPSGAFSVCHICGEEGVASGDYCENSAWNSAVDSVLPIIEQAIADERERVAKELMDRDWETH